MRRAKTTKDKHIEQVVETSAAQFLPRAVELVWQEFCSDCERRHECEEANSCVGCRTAQTMVKVQLILLIATIAKMN